MSRIIFDDDVIKAQVLRKYLGLCDNPNFSVQHFDSLYRYLHAATHGSKNFMFTYKCYLHGCWSGTNVASLKFKSSHLGLIIYTNTLLTNDNCWIVTAHLKFHNNYAQYKISN